MTLRLWIDPAGPDGERACCSPAAVVAARETCHALGVPHVTLDLREGFRRAVVAPFVAGYERGETPNPCIRCNGSFRFAAAPRVRPPRSARRASRPATTRACASTAAACSSPAPPTPAKDQSYMLARLDPRMLDRLWFPLGERTKEETRAAPAPPGSPRRAGAESQEACFLAGGDYRDFLARTASTPAEGPIVDEGGNEVGRHDGFWRFTPGQRRGLGVATGEPLYALRTEPRTNTVVVGPRASLARTQVGVRSGRLYVPVERADAKLRYRSPGRARAASSSGPRLPPRARRARLRRRDRARPPSCTRTTPSSAPD